MYRNRNTNQRAKSAATMLLALLAAGLLCLGCERREDASKKTAGACPQTEAAKTADACSQAPVAAEITPPVTEPVSGEPRPQQPATSPTVAPLPPKSRETVRTSVGPERSADETALYLDDAPHARSPDNNVLYTLENNRLQVRDLVDGGIAVPELPPNFPRFSWPSGVAYDSRRHLVSVVSFGGDGCWYRYDVKAGKWLDFRSLNGLDLGSLAYDPQTDRYVAHTTLGRDTLLFVSGELQPLFERPLKEKPEVPGRVDDRNSAPAREVSVVFGPPVAAEYPTAADGFLELSEDKPPHHLAEGAEIVVVTGYEPTEAERRGSGVRVAIDRPGNKVVLVLASYENVHWRVTATPGTRLAGILASGYHRPAVSVEATDETVPVFLTKISYMYKEESLPAMRADLARDYGIERIDVLRASYAIPPEIVINRPDMD